MSVGCTDKEQLDRGCGVKNRWGSLSGALYDEIPRRAALTGGGWHGLCLCV